MQKFHKDKKFLIKQFRKEKITSLNYNNKKT